MPAARPTASLISRTLAAWQEAGLPVGAVKVHPDGSVEVLAPGQGAALSSPASGKGGNSCDGLFPGESA